MAVPRAIGSLLRCWFADALRALSVGKVIGAPTNRAMKQV
jgi:hypothetical protein